VPAGTHTGLCSHRTTQRELKAPGASPSTGDPQFAMHMNCHQVFLHPIPAHWDERAHHPGLVWGRKGLGARTGQGNRPTGAAGDGVQLVASPHCSFSTGSPDAGGQDALDSGLGAR